MKHATLWPGSTCSSGGASLAGKLDLEPAARGERARLGRKEHVARGALDRVERRLASGVEAGDALEQAERVRVPWLGEHLPRRAGLDEHPGVHHVHALAHAGDDAQVVRDQDQCRVPLGDQLAKQAQNLRLNRDVERCRRLVGDQHLRLAGERHRDHRPLAHPPENWCG